MIYWRASLKAAPGWLGSQIVLINYFGVFKSLKPLEVEQNFPTHIESQFLAIKPSHSIQKFYAHDNQETLRLSSSFRILLQVLHEDDSLRYVIFHCVGFVPFHV